MTILLSGLSNLVQWKVSSIYYYLLMVSLLLLLSHALHVNSSLLPGDENIDSKLSYLTITSN